MSSQTIIRRAGILGSSELKDLIIENGRFVSITDSVVDQQIDSLQDANVLDVGGKLVLPGFVDMHTHLDKAFTWPDIPNISGTLQEAISRYEAAQERMSVDSIKQRMITTICSAIQHGTTAIRTHLDFGTPNYLRKVVKAFQTVKSYFADYIDLEAVLMCPWYIDKKIEADIRWAVENGIHVLGGAPHLAENPQRNLDKIFDLAVSLNTDIDLHVDESDDPNTQTLRDVCDRTIQAGYQGRVIAGHCTSLSAMDEVQAKEIMLLVKEASVGIVTLPGCNLFLQGRQDVGLIRRGLTRVKQFLELGVPVAVASDNIRDPFHPYGKADLLQMALLASYGAHLTSENEMNKLIEMITLTPAQLVNIEDYGISNGNWADFVILDTDDPRLVLSEQPTTRQTWRHGQQVCRVNQSIDWNVELHGVIDSV